jgi:hypothetical protein
MINGEFLVLLMIRLSEHAELDQEKLDQKMVLVDHDVNLLISFTAKIIVLCIYLLSLFIHNQFIPYFLGRYLRGHGLKYQNLLIPNGMVAGLFGTSMSHNDIGVLNMSRLMRYLVDVFYPEYSLAGGLLPCQHYTGIQTTHQYSQNISGGYGGTEETHSEVEF